MEKKKYATETLGALLIDALPPAKSQPFCAGGNVVNRIFILLTKFINFETLGGRKKKTWKLCYHFI